MKTEYLKNNMKSKIAGLATLVGLVGCGSEYQGSYTVSADAQSSVDAGRISNDSSSIAYREADLLPLPLCANIDANKTIETTDTLLEGESRKYSLNNGCVYEVTLMYVGDHATNPDMCSAKFLINKELTPLLMEGESYDHLSGLKLNLKGILYQAYAGGVHSATICFDQSKLSSLEDACKE